MSDAEDTDIIVEQFDVNQVIAEPDELLISLVKNYPSLYDKLTSDYGNVQTKKKIWNEIADTLQITASKAENKWLRMREKYSRERKLMESSGSGFQSKWSLFHRLQFLDDHVKRRRIRSNLVSSTKVIQYQSPSTSRSSSSCERNLDSALYEISDIKTGISSNNSKVNDFDTDNNHLMLKEISDTLMCEKIKENFKCTKKDLRLLSSKISSLSETLHTVLHEKNNMQKNADEIFAALVIAELEKMPEDIKRIRKCEISEILFKPL